MKTLLNSVRLAVSAVAISAGIAAADTGTDRTKIESVLRTYERALNTSDTSTVMTLYAPDGVFMPQHSPSQVGTAAVRAAYIQVFKTITLDVKFDITEIVVVAPDWAFARTNSAGFVTVNASGNKGPEANQELFIFHKTASGDWKIARYCFSTTNPPRQ